MTSPAEVVNAEVVNIAKVCHEANRAYCGTLGDDSQPTWEEAPDWQRESAINGVRAILTGEVITPEQSHENWLAEKRDAGWSWGPVKDPEAKVHPCFLPYAELPEEQRLKDALFFAIVAALSGLPPVPPHTEAPDEIISIDDEGRVSGRPDGVVRDPDGGY